jgi:hypothetical protein
MVCLVASFLAGRPQRKTDKLGADVTSPALRAAFWTGVGRHTVWGNGAIETEVQGGR